MRKVRVATTAFLVEDFPHTPELNLERASGYVRDASARGAQIVCLPETVTTVNVPEDPALHADPYPGPVTKFFARAAKAGRIAVVAPYLVRSGKRVYNQATLFDPKGEIAGVYRKVQPTGAELAFTTPGNSLPVFRLPFGKIAVMICMDVYFPEIARIYAARGADIVFWPTVTHGPTQEGLGIQIRARAMDYGLVLVESNLAGYPPYAPYSGRFRPATARIVDRSGDILAQTGRRHGIAIADIDLDEVRLTSECVLLREPDHIKEDLDRLMRKDLYAREYARMARGAGAGRGVSDRHKPARERSAGRTGRRGR